MLTDEQILEIAEKHHASHPGVDEWWEFRDRDDVVAFGRAILAASARQAEAYEPYSPADFTLLVAKNAGLVQDVARLNAEILRLNEELHVSDLVQTAAPTPAAAQDERGAFEAWAMGEFGFAALPIREGNGYKNAGVDAAYAGWQARAAASPGISGTGRDTVSAIRKAIDFLNPNFGVGAPSPEAALATLRSALAEIERIDRDAAK